MLSKILNDSLEETLSKRQYIHKHIKQDSILFFPVPFLMYKQATKDKKNP